MSQVTRAVVADVLPALFPAAFPGHPDSPASCNNSPAALRPLTGLAVHQVGDLLRSGDFDAWSEALSRVGNCSHPIRLHGHSQTVDTRTGEIIRMYSSSREPLGITHVRCGNRRERVCPSCSRLYAADMFHLIRAGVAGGKTVPTSVGENPLVFATVTAPSFGHVHGRRDSGPCRPTPRRRGASTICRHGRPTVCPIRHDEGDPLLGQPLCCDCYDYASHVVWQWWAPDLWRRFTIALRRLVARTLGVPATRLGEHATVQYAKVAEFQLRGVVHFHALVRLDGPKTPEGFAAAPTGIDQAALAVLVEEAARSVRLTVPGVDPDDPERVLVFGRQLDARPVRTSRRDDDPGRGLSPEQVAGYLAKYATKTATDADVGTGTGYNGHHRRSRATVRRLAARAEAHNNGQDHEGETPYVRLGKWTHMLGFRGHFATKSRRYSITLGALRRAQALIAEHRDTGRPLDLAALEADLLADHEDETTLVIGHWTYAGTGWATEGQTALATAAAARAREHARERARISRSHQPEEESW
ncbi:MAG: replication initiator [Nocardioidaceae bacterium]